MSGWEGIYANLSLRSLALMSAVDLATKARRRKDPSKQTNAMINFCLIELLQGSLMGSALTGMVTCLSQRRGDETYNSLTVSTAPAWPTWRMPPNREKTRNLQAVLALARKELLVSQTIVARGVAGKYQALRRAEVMEWGHRVYVLEQLSGPART